MATSYVFNELADINDIRDKLQTNRIMITNHGKWEQIK